MHKRQEHHHFQRLSTSNTLETSTFQRIQVQTLLACMLDSGCRILHSAAQMFHIRFASILSASSTLFTILLPARPANASSLSGFRKPHAAVTLPVGHFWLPVSLLCPLSFDLYAPMASFRKENSCILLDQVTERVKYFIRHVACF